jgi:hypothetical protein
VRELLAGGLQRVGAYLLEPPPDSRPREPAPPEIEIRTREPAPASASVLLLGLTRRCGVSTLARGLAAQMGAGGAAQGHVVSLLPSGEGSSLRRGGGCVWDLPGNLHDAVEVAEYGRLVGRLAAGSTLIWDVPASELQRVRELEPAPAVLVVPGQSQPALAELVAETLRGRLPELLVVANRVRSPQLWSGLAAICVPDSRLGALLAARGMRPGGGMGEALARLAELIRTRGPWKDGCQLDPRSPLTTRRPR